MARAFPLILFAGLAFPALRHLLQTHRLERQHLVLAVSFGLFCLLGLGIGSLSTEGPSAWMHWKSQNRPAQPRNDLRRTSDWLEAPLHSRIGQRYLRRRRCPPARTWTSKKGCISPRQDCSCFFCSLPGGLPVVKRTPILLMHVVFFALLISSRYYWSILALFPLWQTAAPPEGKPSGHDLSSLRRFRYRLCPYWLAGAPAVSRFRGVVPLCPWRIEPLRPLPALQHLARRGLDRADGLDSSTKNNCAGKQAQDGKKRTNGVRSGPR